MKLDLEYLKQKAEHQVEYFKKYPNDTLAVRPRDAQNMYDIIVHLEHLTSLTRVALDACKQAIAHKRTIDPDVLLSAMDDAAKFFLHENES